MRAAKTDYLLITDLMESAWLLNLRADDVLYTPVFFSFILLTQDKVTLYIMDGTLADGLPDRLSFMRAVNTCMSNGEPSSRKPPVRHRASAP